MRKKKMIPFETMTPETRDKVARWLRARIAEMEPDAASINEEEGPDFLPALRGLADHAMEAP
jgi:hypothetical protein